MPNHTSTAIYLPFVEKPGQSAPSHESQPLSRILLGWTWHRERWWYKLAHICRRWRCLLLGSSSHLGLSLLCTHGTPVTDLLAHSPPLPLIIDHIDVYLYPGMSTEDDEKDMLLALRYRDRVRRIRLMAVPWKLERLIMTMNEEFPRLKYLYIGAEYKHNVYLVLPKACQAPHLRLIWIPPSVYFHPNDLLGLISHMSQLETLRITFHSPVPNRDVERQLLLTPIMTHVTLVNLHWFVFGGASAYLEALLPQMTLPLLEKSEIEFSNQLTFAVPCLLKFMCSAENFKFSSARFKFDEKKATVFVCRPATGAHTFCMQVYRGRPDEQVSSVAQVFEVLSPVIYEVEHLILTLDYRSYNPWHHEAGRSQWRKLLRSFNNVKTLCMDNDNGLVSSSELSRFLWLDGEPPLELLPKLKELRCPLDIDPNDPFIPRTVNSCEPFTAFIDARRIAGHPVVLIAPFVGAYKLGSLPTSNFPSSSPHTLVSLVVALSIRRTSFAGCCWLGAGEEGGTRLLEEFGRMLNNLCRKPRRCRLLLENGICRESICSKIDNAVKEVRRGSRRYIGYFRTCARTLVAGVKRIAKWRTKAIFGCAIYEGVEGAWDSGRVLAVSLRELAPIERADTSPDVPSSLPAGVKPREYMVLRPTQLGLYVPVACASQTTHCVALDRDKHTALPFPWNMVLVPGSPESGVVVRERDEHVPKRRWLHDRVTPHPAADRGGKVEDLREARGGPQGIAWAQLNMCGGESRRPSQRSRAPSGEVEREKYLLGEVSLGLREAVWI
ncbi:hypothetical protein BJV74DRAFT_989284 [Russula compacta]|nr:hypothetical protein BJV74DRAFT_989284 [Russula compacta]